MPYQLILIRVLIDIYTCVTCSNTYTEPVASNGHKYEEVVTPPTCSNGGYTTYTYGCGHSYTSGQVSVGGYADVNKDAYR